MFATRSSVLLNAAFAITLLVAAACTGDTVPLSPSMPPALAAAAIDGAFGHVFLVTEAKAGYSGVIDVGAMPYLDSLAGVYGLATQYYANTHPSIGNYFMLATGRIVSNRDNYSKIVSTDNVVRRLVAAGKTWKSYAEDLPSVGYTGPSVGNYARNHNVFALLSDVAKDASQRDNLVPFSQFQADLANEALPAFSNIVPNVCHDGLTCPSSTADAWLRANVGPLLASPVFQQDGLLIISFDEAANDNANGGGRVPLVVVSARGQRGFRSTVLYQHQSTLRLILSSLGITTFPSAAATAPEMAEFFEAPPLPPPSPSTVATIVVAPDTVSITPGDTAQLSATTLDSAGNPLTGRTVTWGSSDPTFATVSSNGLVTGVAAGSATITATSEGQNGSAAVVVKAPPPPPPPTGPPGAVTDLSVASVGDTMVTLSFREVTDGAGGAASYDVRYSPAPILWWAAIVTARGTCATPASGGTVGAARTCTITGLAPGTAYQFQAVAFRGALDVDAIFGPLSNIAGATTSNPLPPPPPPPAPVASVTVSPATFGLAVGGTQQLTATLRDAAGNTLTGRTVTWTSSNSGIATVLVTGLVTAIGAGTATITATSEGQGGSAVVSVSTSAFLVPDILNNASFEAGFDGLTNASGAVPDLANRDATYAFDGSYALKRPLPITGGGDLTGYADYRFYLVGPATTYDRLWTRFYFYIDTAINGTFKLHQLFTPSYSTQFSGLYFENGYLSAFFTPELSNGFIRLARLGDLRGGWHSLEMDYWRNGDPSGNPSVAVWLDGVPFNSALNAMPSPASWVGGRIQFGTRGSSGKIGVAHWLGVLNGTPANTIAGNVWIDRVAVSTRGRIGP